ncbi:hypothetical protein Vafri_13451 [Volvox africanus]|nr:hypothetical protein Vafri_13451 [Volvox africanus]
MFRVILAVRYSQDACICDTDKLEAARGAFDHAYGIFPGIAVGNFVMFVAGVWLLMNLACQVGRWIWGNDCFCEIYLGKDSCLHLLACGICWYEHTVLPKLYGCAPP